MFCLCCAAVLTAFCCLEQQQHRVSLVVGGLEPIIESNQLLLGYGWVGFWQQNLKKKMIWYKNSEMSFKIDHILVCIELLSRNIQADAFHLYCEICSDRSGNGNPQNRKNQRCLSNGWLFMNIVLRIDILHKCSDKPD